LPGCASPIDIQPGTVQALSETVARIAASALNFFNAMFLSKCAPISYYY
jgi:hypothetical protein